MRSNEEKRQPSYIRVADQIKAEWIQAPSARPGQKLPTARDLQERYGVSRDTITRALSRLANQGLVRMRQGSGIYIREPVAGTRSNRLIGFVAPQIIRPPALYSPVEPFIYLGLERRAQETGHHVLTASSSDNVLREEEVIEQFVRVGVDGLIVHPANSADMRQRSNASGDHLARRWKDIPIVLVDLGFEEWERPIVQFDNYRLGYDMTRALLAHGHQNILCMQTSSDHIFTSIQERCLGWKAALLHSGRAVPLAYEGWPLQLHDFVGDLDAVGPERFVRSLLDLEPRPDALIAWEDGIAMQLTLALQAAGVSVPEEMRITGFDNTWAGRLFEPAFPTSDPDFSLIGERALDLLNRMIDSQSLRPRTYLLPVPVLWRDPAASETGKADGTARQESLLTQT